MVPNARRGLREHTIRRVVVALLAVLALAPSGVDLLLDVVAHALHSEDVVEAHAAGDADPEHQCTGPVHHCGCCASLSVIAAERCELASSDRVVVSLPPADHVIRPDGDAHGQPPFRPPAA